MKNARKTDSSRLSVLQKFGLFFFRNKEITIVFWLAAVVFGLLSYTTLMKRQGFPNVDVPVSIVSGTYFVNDKNIVDQQVALPASTAIKKLPQVKSVDSQSADNVFILTISYKDGTSSAQGNNLVRDALRSGILPQSATAEFKAIDAGRFAEQSDLLISVYSSNSAVTTEQLQDRASAVAKQFAGLSTVQNAVVLKQIESGTNPATGQPQQEQRTFDRYGVRDASGSVLFYRSVMIGLRAKPTADALQLYDDVQTKIQNLSSDAKFNDVRLSVSADFAEGIRSQISNLQTSLLEGFAIVIVVSFLLISWRAGIVTALSMATVQLITIGILYASGITLNTITLFALILSLGLIVDDTIIVVEAIDAARGSSNDKYRAVSRAIGRVARASLTGTITTMLAFAPMLFISGILGEFIRILPISIIVSLAASLLVSLSVVPFMGRFLLKNNHTASAESLKSSFNPFTKVEDLISSGLARMVRAGEHSLKRRLLIGATTMAIGLMFFAASLPLFSKLKFDIFPSTKDSNEIAVSLQFDDNTTLQQAQATSDEANDMIGNALGKNMRRLSYLNTGSNTSVQMDIMLTSYKDREVTSPELIGRVQAALSGLHGARVKVSQIDAGPPKDDYPFAVRISANDPAKAQALANDIRTFLQDKTIERPNGTTAKVVRTALAPSEFITRSQAERYIEVKAGFDADDVSTLVSQAKTAMTDHYDTNRLQKYGIGTNQLVYDFGSESDNQDSFKSMLIAFPILIAIMYLLLLQQFRSFLQPLLIFIAIPFSFFGVAAGLYNTKNPLSFFVMVGFFALIGIAVNNTILLTDYANQERERGLSIYQAMAAAIKARFRPLLTTSITGVVGLIPLALSDPFWESLSVTLIFGLLSSTFLVIIVYPYLYLFGEWLRGIGRLWWKRRLWRPLQIVMDIMLAPLRFVRFLWWLAFHWQHA